MARAWRRPRLVGLGQAQQYLDGRVPPACTVCVKPSSPDGNHLKSLWERMFGPPQHNLMGDARRSCAHLRKDCATTATHADNDRPPAVPGICRCFVAGCPDDATRPVKAPTVTIIHPSHTSKLSYAGFAQQRAASEYFSTYLTRCGRQDSLSATTVHRTRQPTVARIAPLARLLREESTRVAEYRAAPAARSASHRKTNQTCHLHCES